jgi:Holliday junction resolvase RusA-like endonuclease
MTTLIIPGPPPTVTAQQKGVRIAPHNGTMKPFWFKRPAFKKAEDAMLASIPRGKPYAGPVGVRLELQWPFRKSEPKRNRAAGWMYKDTKPDTDNCAKMILDCLQKRQFGFSDDAQIADLKVVKTWGDEAFTRITVWSLDADPAPESWVDKYIKEKANQ